MGNYFVLDKREDDLPELYGPFDEKETAEAYAEYLDPDGLDVVALRAQEPPAIEETADVQPTVYLVMGDEKGARAFAFDDAAEIVETVEWLPDGKPDWRGAGICDARGPGGQEGVKQLYEQLYDILNTAERNAAVVGFKIVRVPR